MGMKKIKIKGMQSEKNTTTFALGSRKMCSYFEHENHSTAALTQPDSDAIAKFSAYGW